MNLEIGILLRAGSGRQAWQAQRGPKGQRDLPPLCLMVLIVPVLCRVVNIDVSVHPGPGCAIHALTVDNLRI